MGGHSAWKKRVAKGQLAIKSGGAIARHRPRWGRKGKDLIKNRKGFIGGGNPKKKKNNRNNKNEEIANQQLNQEDEANPIIGSKTTRDEREFIKSPETLDCFEETSADNFKVC